MSSDIINKRTYERLNVVRFYANQKELQVSEKLIFSKVESFIKDKKVLDIGIGGGRTTHHLLPLSKEYIGIDISSEMINSCRKQYKSPKGDFVVCDARNLVVAADNSIDFVMFSFNGIDCVPHGDRSAVLSEVYRVLKPGGYFAFSTHNVRNLTSLYSFHLSKHPIRFFYQIKRYLKLKAINGAIEKYQNREWFSIRDGAENFQTEVVYVKPEQEFQELLKYGFTNLSLFSNETKSTITVDQVMTSSEAWIYFLCQK